MIFLLVSMSFWMFLHLNNKAVVQWYILLTVQTTAACMSMWLHFGWGLSFWWYQWWQHYPLANMKMMNVTTGSILGCGLHCFVDIEWLHQWIECTASRLVSMCDHRWPQHTHLYGHILVRHIIFVAPIMAVASTSQFNGDGCDHLCYLWGAFFCIEVNIACSHFWRVNWWANLSKGLMIKRARNFRRSGGNGLTYCKFRWSGKKGASDVGERWVLCTAERWAMMVNHDYIHAWSPRKRLKIIISS